MAETSTIEWTDATWNPITGCSVVSPGCANCYAMRLAGRRLKYHWSREDLTEESKAGPVWTGKVRLNREWLGQPLRWRRPRRIFVCAHGDLFHESVPDAWIDRVFAVMALAQRHTFQVLTKRADRMREYMTAAQRRLDITTAVVPHQTGEARLGELVSGYTWPLPNVWMGVSVEDQARADARIPPLLDTPAAIRFVSAEPLLGPVDLMRIPKQRGRGPALEPIEINDGTGQCVAVRPNLDWVIAGGESGPNARPMHPDWARSLRDQCVEADVPFHFKQWGSWAPKRNGAGDGTPSKWMLLSQDGDLDIPDDRAPLDHLGECAVIEVGKKRAGRLLDGRTWDEFPGRDGGANCG